MKITMSGLTLLLSLNCRFHYFGYYGKNPKHSFCLWIKTAIDIESIKTTSMEYVSTRVLEKKRIFKKVKPKNDLMYQDI